jgi:hypothetical protein
MTDLENVEINYIGAFGRIPTDSEVSYGLLRLSNSSDVGVLFDESKDTDEWINGTIGANYRESVCANTTEKHAYYEQLVLVLYKNLFDRTTAGDLSQPEIDYWKDELINGNLNENDILYTMANAALVHHTKGAGTQYLLSMMQLYSGVTEKDVIYAYLAGLGRGPTEEEVSTILSASDIDTIEKVFEYLRTTDEGASSIPNIPLNLVSMIYMNLFNLQYSQAWDQIDYYTSKVVIGDYTVNNVHYAIINNPREYPYVGSDEESASDLSVIERKQRIMNYVYVAVKTMITKYNEAYAALHSEYSIDEHGNLIDRYEETEADITIDQITSNVAISNNVVTGDGVFDKIMESVNAQIDNQYEQNRLTGTEYAQVYTSMATTAMQLAFDFVVKEPVNEENIKLVRANRDLTKRKTI